MLALVAQLAVGNETGTAAIITAIGVLLVGVFAALFKFTSNADARMDRLSVESMATMAKARDDAQVDAAEERAAASAAFKERDKWLNAWQVQHEENTALKVELAQVKSELSAIRARKDGER